MDLSQVTPPTVGRIVHYTVRDGQRRGETRAAIITRTFHGAPYKGPDGTLTPPLDTNWAVNLTIFDDKSNPALHEETHASSAMFDPDGKPGTWRYQPVNEKLLAAALPLNPEPVVETPAAESTPPAVEPAPVEKPVPVEEPAPPEPKKSKGKS
jgi:hypothetical protein